ncbi:MAG: hypothetical protein R3C05_01750 [Pirellulaceae bacterium]
MFAQLLMSADRFQRCLIGEFTDCDYLRDGIKLSRLAVGSARGDQILIEPVCSLRVIKDAILYRTGSLFDSMVEVLGNAAIIGCTR